MQPKRTRTIVTAATLGFLAFTICLLVASTTPVKVNLEPGQYQFIVGYKIQGEQTAKPRTIPRCIRADQLESPEEIFDDSAFDKRKASESCKVKNLKERGQSISYDVECSNRLVHVEGAVRGTEFSVVRNVRPKTTHGVSLKFTLEGRRTGDCKLEDKKTKP